MPLARTCKSPWEIDRVAFEFAAQHAGNCFEPDPHPIRKAEDLRALKDHLSLWASLWLESGLTKTSRACSGSSCPEVHLHDPSNITPVPFKRHQSKAHLKLAKAPGVPSPFFPGILLSRKLPNTQRKRICCFKRTMVEKNGESTPRKLAKADLPKACERIWTKGILHLGILSDKNWLSCPSLEKKLALGLTTGKPSGKTCSGEIH